jgi:hypothetical protein
MRLQAEVDKVLATRMNTCKIPTQPYAFLKKEKQNVFTLDNSFQDSIYSKYKDAIWRPVIENTRDEVLVRVEQNLKEIQDINLLLDPRRIDLLDSSFEQLVSSFGDSGIGLISFVAREYRKQAKAKLYIDHEKRFLREKLQNLIISTGNMHIIQKERNESHEVYTKIKNAKALFRGMTQKNSEDDIKFLRIVNKVHDEKLRSLEHDEEAFAALKAKGRWYFILDLLEAKAQETKDKSLIALVGGMNRNPARYRCFFLGINNMDYDQFSGDEGEELKTLKVSSPLVLFAD